MYVKNELNVLFYKTKDQENEKILTDQTFFTIPRQTERSLDTTYRDSLAVTWATLLLHTRLEAAGTALHTDHHVL